MGFYVIKIPRAVGSFADLRPLMLIDGCGNRIPRTNGFMGKGIAAERVTVFFIKNGTSIVCDDV